MYQEFETRISYKYEVNLGKYVSKNKITGVIQAISNQDYEKVASQIGHGTDEIKRVMGLL